MAWAAWFRSRAGNRMSRQHSRFPLADSALQLIKHNTLGHTPVLGWGVWIMCSSAKVPGYWLQWLFWCHHSGPGNAQNNFSLRFGGLEGRVLYQDSRRMAEHVQGTLEGSMFLDFLISRTTCSASAPQAANVLSTDLPWLGLGIRHELTAAPGQWLAELAGRTGRRPQCSSSSQACSSLQHNVDGDPGFSGVTILDLEMRRTQNN